MANTLKSLVCLSSALLIAGCSASTATDSAVQNGMLGAAVGAGTGAAIGAGISGGKVGASALLGGGIGLGVGVVGGALYHHYSRNGELNNNQELIETNHSSILAMQERLDQYRENLHKELSEIVVDESTQEYKYQGTALGNPYR